MDTISKIILSHQNRGLKHLFDFLPESACADAAKAIYRQTKGKIWIVTGFCCFGKGESDGPIGSHFLALALQKLGFIPRIVTDRYSFGYFNDNLNDDDDINVNANPNVNDDGDDDYGKGCFNSFSGFKTGSCKKTNSFSYSTYCFQTKEALLKLFDAEKPVAIISIERCGRAKDGKYYSMRKKDISAVTPPLDELFLNKPAECISIGVGDGGNEIGMGCYHDLLAKHCDIIPSSVCCDFPIVATVSNWGTYGLIAALENCWKTKIGISEASKIKKEDIILKDSKTMKEGISFKDCNTMKKGDCKTMKESNTMKKGNCKTMKESNTMKDGNTEANCLLPTRNDIEDYFQHLLRLEAPDGILGPGYHSVDGFPISYDLEVIEALRML